MIYLQLFFEFFKIGLFAVGGGLAAIPFLYDIADHYTWFTRAQVADMIAISESTPGPIGINMATYAGFTTAGVLGSVTATAAVILPEIIIVLLVAKTLEKFKCSDLVQSAFYGIRPAATALISVACFEVMKISLLRWDAFLPQMDWGVLFNWPAILFFALLLFLVMKFKKHPILYIAGAALIGMLFPFA